MEIRLAQINEALKSILTIEAETTEPVQTVQPEVDLKGLDVAINNLIKTINS
jgi:hypothetical protein